MHLMRIPRGIGSRDSVAAYEKEVLRRETGEQGNEGVDSDSDNPIDDENPYQESEHDMEEGIETPLVVSSKKSRKQVDGDITRFVV